MLAQLTLQPLSAQTISTDLIEALPIVVVGLDGRIIGANQSAASLHGYDHPAELLGVNTLELVSHEDRTAWHLASQGVIANKTATCLQNLPVQLQRRDGSQFPALINLTVARDAASQPVGLISTIHDISAQHATQQQIQQALGTVADLQTAQAQLQTTLGELQEQLAVMTRFVSMVSHDFRTPLTAILTYADLLESYSERFSEDRRRHYLNQIQDNVKHLKRLLDDVLIISRAQVGHLAFQPAPIDLARFCGDLIDNLRLSTPADWILDLAMDDDLQAACMDEKLLRQILDNLLANAIKYSPHGGHIALGVRRAGQFAVFSVTDQGQGIGPDEQAQVFDAFYRASNAGQAPGHGLGLAIVKHSVEVHRGSITLSSQIGVGTTFVVKLPLQSPEPTSDNFQKAL